MSTTGKPVQKKTSKPAAPLEIRIGVANNPKELVIESLLTTAELGKLVATATGSATPGQGVLHLQGQDGQELLIPGSALAYVQVAASAKRPIGFVA